MTTNPPMPSHGPCMELRDLRLALGHGTRSLPVLRGVTLHVHAGECLGLVGESGSGKTLTARTILGLLPRGQGWITEGSVFFHGRNLVGAPESVLRSLRGDRMAMVFQDPRSAFNPFLRLSMQITEALMHHRRIREEEALTKAVRLLERVGIPDAGRRIHDHPHRFSGGMLQRAMIAMALMTDPELLVADEPTSALDVTLQAQILRLLDSLRKEFRTAVLLITHDLAVAAESAERLAVMYAGRIVEQGPTARLLEAPAHPYMKALLRSTPAQGRRANRRLAEIPGRPPGPGEVLRGCAFAPRCSQALPRCTGEFPPLLTLEEGHDAACFRV